MKQLEYPFKLMLTQKIEATHNRFTSWRHKNDLFFSIITWVLVATAAYTLLNWLWGDRGIFSGWSLEENTSTPLERIKVSLTILGGIGGIGYLVIKFRERSALERSEADEKLVRAVQQLGDTSPQVRIAGVYALADVADTYEGPYHQRVVDILCGYLRTDRLLKDANGETRYATNKDGFFNYDHPLSSDGPVESAILSIIASHLRPLQTAPKNKRNKTDLGPWSSYRIDLHNTILTEQVYFVNCHFKQLDLRRATLFDRAIFSGSHFFEAASFEYSTFKQTVDFNQAHFDFHSSFQGALFKKMLFSITPNSTQRPTSVKLPSRETPDFTERSFLIFAILVIRNLCRTPASKRLNSILHTFENAHSGRAQILHPTKSKHLSALGY